MAVVRTLNCDGSLTNFGFSVTDIDLEAGKIVNVVTSKLSETEPDKTKGVKKSTDDLFRFRTHWLELNRLIETYNVSYVIAEIPSGAQDSRAAFAFGGITALMSAVPVPLVAVTPREAKIAATGHPHADKEDIIQWAYKEWPHVEWFVSKRSNKMNIRTATGLYLANKNEHISDSLAIAVAGIPKLKTIF